MAREWIRLYYQLSPAGRGAVCRNRRILRRVQARWTLWSLIIQAVVYTNIFLIILPQGNFMTVVTAICSGVSLSMFAHMDRVARATGRW